MGYIRHHAILVTTYDTKMAQVAHQKAKEICGDCVSEMSDTAINGYCSFAVFPDGSKEGWEDSDKGDQARATFIAWLETQRYEDRSTSYDWVEVQYGDDDGETGIIHDSDEWKRAKQKKLAANGNTLDK